MFKFSNADGDTAVMAGAPPLKIAKVQPRGFMQARSIGDTVLTNGLLFFELRTVCAELWQCMPSVSLYFVLYNPSVCNQRTRQ